MLKNLLRNILLLIVSVTFCLYLVELLLGFYLVKSIMHYPLPPFSEQTHTNVDFSVRYSYNNISLRGSNFEPTRLYDMALLGDSFMFGYGVDEDKTLQGIFSKQGYSVLNISEMAMQPIDYYHKLKVLQSHSLKVKNIIVGLYMGNDFLIIGSKRIDHALGYQYRDNFLDYSRPSFLALERLRYQIHSTRFRLSEKLGKRLSDSYQEETKVHDFEHPKFFYTDWIEFFTNNDKNMIITMRNPKPLALGQLNEDAYLKKIQMDEVSREKTVRIILAIVNSARPARVHLLLIPDLYYVSGGFQSQKYKLQVHQLINKVNNSVNIIDLHGMLKTDDYFPHDGHWNARGHRSVADIISRQIFHGRH